MHCLAIDKLLNDKHFKPLNNLHHKGKDGPIITGNANPLPGATEIYTANWEIWNNTFETFANVTWNISGGTVLASDKHTVTIQWNMTQNLLDYNGNVYVMEDLAGNEANYSVTVLDNTPGSPDLCTGVLGAAKVAVDFGSGSNPGAALPPGKTTYHYNPSCVIEVGDYTVVTNTNNCRTLWWNVPQDHTGNTNGYMLMVNGNDTRGEFYRTTVTGLTSNFSYEFSAWCGNLYNQSGTSAPAIRFQIFDPTTGAEIASSGTMEIPPQPVFTWQQVGFKVNIPPGVTSVIVAVVDVQSGSLGNDLVLDDISFAPCYPPMIASFSNTSQVYKAHACLSGTVDLYATWPEGVVAFQNPSYQWERSPDAVNWSAIPGAVTVHYTQLEPNPGIFVYRMRAYETANPAQLLYSNLLTFYVAEPFVTATSQDLTSCAGGVISTLITVPAGLHFADPDDPNTIGSFVWLPSTNLTGSGTQVTFSVNVPSPPSNGANPTVYNYNYSTTYTNSVYGCSATAQQNIAIHSPREVFVPNAFTPGGTSNTLFRPVNLDDYPGSVFRIFNRFGQEVFESSGPTLANYSWDGTVGGSPGEAGTFVWEIAFVGCPTWISGGSGPNVPSGTVILVR
jgi:hypothetical protein